jgi:hypothetical protein
MYGLAARYALRDAEITVFNHDTVLYIVNDAPAPRRKHTARIYRWRDTV